MLEETGKSFHSPFFRSEFLYFCGNFSGRNHVLCRKFFTVFLCRTGIFLFCFLPAAPVKQFKKDQVVTDLFFPDPAESLF